MLFKLFFTIFTVENIPLAASWRHGARKGVDLSPYDLIKNALMVEKVCHDPASLAQRCRWVTDLGEISGEHTV